MSRNPIGPVEQINVVDRNFMEVGFGFVLNSKKITTLMPYGGRMSQKVWKKASDAGTAIDATRGRVKRSLVLLEDGTVIGSALRVETILNREI